MAWHPFRNVGLKVAALALGALLWLTVSGHQIERRLQVPVSYSNVPSPLEMTGDQIDDVSVQVRGSDNIIGGLVQGDLRVVVDLGDSHSGTNLIPLRTDQVTAPLGIEIMRVDPGTVAVTLEKSGMVDAPVEPAIEGTPASGFAIAEVTVSPRTVTLVGPESRLAHPISVMTERISVDGKASTVVQDVSVGVAGADVRLREPRTVRVTVRIEEAHAERRIDQRPVAFKNLGAGHAATLQPTLVSVTVRGTSDVIGSLDPAAITPYVDLTGQPPGSYNLPVRIDLPAGVVLSAIAPTTISVRIR